MAEGRVRDRVGVIEGHGAAFRPENMGDAHSEAARMQTGLSQRLAVAAASGAERVPGAIQTLGDAAGSASGALASGTGALATGAVRLSRRTASAVATGLGNVRDNVGDIQDRTGIGPGGQVDRRGS